MFNSYPYTDFNKVNLDWIMRKLPVDISNKIVMSEKVTVNSFKAIKAGELLFITFGFVANRAINANEVIMRLPANTTTPQTIPVTNAVLQTGNYIQDVTTLFAINNGTAFYGTTILFVESDSNV